jgi:cold-inducible RNA-binding protein
MTRLYLGNLSWDTNEDALRAMVGKDGRTVSNVILKRDKRSGKPRGFAFVDVASEAEAESAIAALNGTTVDGRVIKVRAARELPNRQYTEPDFSSGRGFGGGRGGRDRR